MMNLTKKSRNFLKSSKGYSKKGSIVDQLTLIILPLFLLVIVIAFGFAWGKTSDGLRSSIDTLEGTPQHTQLNASFSNTIEPNAHKYPVFWDFIFVAFVFIVWIIIFISAFILGNNPVFLIIYGIASFGSVITGIAMKVAMVKIVTQDTVLWLVNQMPMTVWLANNYIYVAIVFIISIGIALYMKRE